MLYELRVYHAVPGRLPDQRLDRAADGLHYGPPSGHPAARMTDRRNS